VVDVNISSLAILDSYALTKEELQGEVAARIERVKTGDFRQKEALASWDSQVFSCNYKGQQQQRETCIIIRMQASVSSGTYIRSLANDMGNALGMGAIAYDIFRTRVGDYHLDKAIDLSSTTVPAEESELLYQ